MGNGKAPPPRIEKTKNELLEAAERDVLIVAEELVDINGYTPSDDPDECVEKRLAGAVFFLKALRAHL